MSEVKRHIGKIRKVELNGMTPEEWYQKECEKREISKPDYCDTWKECYQDKFWPLVAVEVNGALWEIVEDREEDDTENISIMKKNSDGTYDYLMQFYNGGTNLDEMLTEAIKRQESE